MCCRPEQLPSGEITTPVNHSSLVFHHLSSEVFLPLGQNLSTVLAGGRTAQRQDFSLNHLLTGFARKDHEVKPQDPLGNRQTMTQSRNMGIFCVPLSCLPKFGRNPNARKSHVVIWFTTPAPS